MRFERGDLVLLAFPFTSEAAAKQRPALVLLDTGDEDLVVARVTTQRRTSEYDVVVQNWSEAGLLGPSTVRVHKLATIEKRLVRKSLGRLQEADWASVRTLLSRISR